MYNWIIRKEKFIALSCRYQIQVKKNTEWTQIQKKLIWVEIMKWGIICNKDSKMFKNYEHILWKN